MNVDVYNAALAKFVLILSNQSGKPTYVQTGRKFDKVYVDGTVRYFVSRYDMGSVQIGDILGAKSKLSPNFNWFFGTLTNMDKWDWSGHHGVPVLDDTVMEVKGYKHYKHYVRKN